MSERLQDMKERALCEFWRWQYLFVVRCFPHVRDEIWQGGYDSGFERGQEIATKTALNAYVAHQDRQAS